MSELAAADTTSDEAGADPGSAPVAATPVGLPDDVRGLSQEIETVRSLPEDTTPGPGLDAPTVPLGAPAADDPIANLLGPDDQGADPGPPEFAPNSEEVLETLGITTQGQPEELPIVAVGPPEAAGAPAGNPSDAKGKSEDAKDKSADANGKPTTQDLPVESSLPPVAMAGHARSVSRSGPVALVPEPATGALLVLGLVALGVRARRG